MRIETTLQPREVVLYAPPPHTPSNREVESKERRLTIIPPAVYVEYDKRGQTQEHRYGGRSWVC